MRLEQLVLFGPSDNFTVTFGPRVTVLSGLDPAERAGLLQTLVEAMAGQVPNASVVFVDSAGRRVFADRMGATYAETGVAAPTLGDLLGTDPSLIADLVTLTADDLGIGATRSPDEVAAELAGARAAHAQVLAEQAAANQVIIGIEQLEAGLAELDERIDRATDDAARWAWIQLRNELDAIRAELAALDRIDDDSDDHEEGDARLLDAVEQLRAAGEAWADASATAMELAEELGPLPPVSDADLARVASTPDILPADLDERIAAIAEADSAQAAAERALAEAHLPPADPGDGVVYQLAQLDQPELWEAHDAATAAQAAYEAELRSREGEGEDHDPKIEGGIEDAHLEVVRCQRELDRRFRPGVLGSGALAVSALLAGDQLSVIVGLVLLAGSMGLGWWLLAMPRQALAQAEHDERESLAHAEADSWLGLHLRRIDHVMQPADRTTLSAALDRCTTTQLDWEERSGGVSLAAAGARRDAILAHAEAIDPAARERRAQASADALGQRVAQAEAAHASLGAALEGYGLSPEGTLDLDPGQIRRVLEQRTAAGRFARQVLELQHQRATAVSTGAILDRLLRDLGFGDGDLAGRLERALVGVEAARARRAQDDPAHRDELEAEAIRLSAEVESGRRLSWDLTPDPAAPPEERGALLDRRHELGLEVASHRRPDLTSIERRLDVATERMRSLEDEERELAEGSGSVRRRLADRIARTTWIGPNEESLPVIIDDAFVGAEPEELFKLLDLIVRLSSSAQIVLMSSDLTVAKWARREAAHGIIALFESDGAVIT